MPAATAFRRPPLVDPAYVSLSDAAVHAAGPLQTLVERALGAAQGARLTPLDQALATRLGGYTQAPPMPDLAAAARAALPPGEWLSLVRAGEMIAVMTRDKQAMMDVLRSMRAFWQRLPSLSEEMLFSCGAEALRLAVELYRRTGQPFLLGLLEGLRAGLPDVSGVMHVFPFQNEYRAEDADENGEFASRMRRFATGRLMADAVAMTALLSQFSGSGRDASAARVGLAALTRYHGLPGGAFSADPYLAGRDPSRAVELPALCAQIEACRDALLCDGGEDFAARLEMLLLNGLSDLLVADGARTLMPVNRLPGDESCAAAPLEGENLTCVLRALLALRQSQWLMRDEATLAYALHLPGGCLVRLGGVPARFHARVDGLFERTIRIGVETARPAQGSLLVRVPAYAAAAEVSLNGRTPKPAKPGEMLRITRAFENGDEIALRLTLQPRLETGYRSSASVYVGPVLMALPLPGEDAAWRYALHPAAALSPGGEDGPRVLAAACEAAQWRAKNGFIMPPPQDVPQGPAYELTLLPLAGTDGRVAAFPRVRA